MLETNSLNYPDQTKLVRNFAGSFMAQALDYQLEKREIYIG